MAMAMAINNNNEHEDSMALFPFGSFNGFGSFGSGCYHPRLPSPTVAIQEVIGVCYGTMGDNLPGAKEVVQLYKSYGIKKMRIYHPDKHILNALQGSNIQVMVGIPNSDLQSLVNNTSATNWVQTNIQAYVPNIKFQYIAVGNEVQPSDSFAAFVLPVMRNIYSAIVEANLEDQIKVSTVISANLLGSSFPPSVGSFSREANELMEPIVGFLVQNASPLLANLYPYYTYMSGTFTLDYALFNGPSVVKDGNFDYHNVFEVMVDAIYAALEKCGGTNVSIVVSESGWPSAGDGNTKVENGVAGSYYSNLIKFVQGGTQRRPGRAIETYLFAMFDENLRSPAVDKHFGLFTYDQKLKYVINLNFSLY
ncbi:glucan endo-1,3-beta-glucosidase isoform X3 [Cucumis sativus]|nr:glucan endo-1,3-beta-glucosidase isoform X3 [Cucumis sativus]XP_011660146.1 glucan endo-1,3-beta-glucosidase isoform X3 [Cucumis sativus]XP_011660147.1 glucan endo-1,3-beta-glucosidase isoform X3 [Cucumis sativus]XP_011660148.1 glucan endo-1,3-beta-glucosidase isoform X3 [Cucumis sativus]KAE8653517.1 hypothetical protein Csa_007014 [Cucumis sativus]